MAANRQPLAAREQLFGVVGLPGPGAQAGEPAGAGPPATGPGLVATDTLFAQMAMSRLCTASSGQDEAGAPSATLFSEKVLLSEKTLLHVTVV